MVARARVPGRAEGTSGRDLQMAPRHMCELRPAIVLVPDVTSQLQNTLHTGYYSTEMVPVSGVVRALAGHEALRVIQATNTAMDQH